MHASGIHFATFGTCPHNGQAATNQAHTCLATHENCNGAMVPSQARESTFILPRAAGGMPPLCAPSPLDCTQQLCHLTAFGAAHGSPPLGRGHARRHGQQHGCVAAPFNKQTRKTNHCRFWPWFCALPCLSGRAHVVFSRIFYQQCCRAMADRVF